MSLVARHLEESGLPTVVISSARDIVENVGVPRHVFVDFPLGNPCGEPHRPDMQLAIVSMALDLLVTADRPRTTVQAPYVWSKGQRWKELIFTEEQPFLDEEAHENWLKAKEKYRELKKEGKV